MNIFKKGFGILLLVLFSSLIYAQEFVNPVGFVDNDANRQKVIAYIQKQLKEDPGSVGLDDPVHLRRAVKQQIEAFKELSKVKNTVLLQSMIKSYCGLGMYNYLLILMMYKENDKTYPQTLEW